MKKCISGMYLFVLAIFSFLFMCSNPYESYSEGASRYRMGNPAQRVAIEIPIEEQKLSEAEKKAKMREHFKNANEYYKDGDYEAAISEWEEVLKLDPEHKLSIEKIARAKEKLVEKPSIEIKEKARTSPSRGYPMWLKK